MPDETRLGRPAEPPEIGGVVGGATSDAESGAGAAPPPRREAAKPSHWVRECWRWSWSEKGLPLWLMVLFTGALAFAAFAQLDLARAISGAQQGQANALNNAVDDLARKIGRGNDITQNAVNEANATNREALRAFNRIVQSQLRAAARASAVQATNARRVLSAQIENSRLSQRAWLGLQNVALASPIAAHEPIRINIAERNTGHTPAIGCTLRFVLFSAPLSSRAPGHLAWSSMPARSFGVVYPNSTVVSRYSSTQGLRPFRVPPGLLRAYDSGKVAIFLWLRIGYTDIFGVKHWAQGCFDHTGPDKQLSMHFCGGSVDSNLELPRAS